jgi:DNA-binding protein HU-beta
MFLSNITPIALKKPLIYNIWVVNIWVKSHSDLNVRRAGSKYYKNDFIKYMNKQGLIELVHGKVGGTKVQAEEIVDGMFDAIVSTLKKSGEVSIAGFGIFSVKARAARMARNPKTGEQVKVAAKKVPKFRAAKALKDAVS